jgi:hypothetical protein
LKTINFKEMGRSVSVSQAQVRLYARSRRMLDQPATCGNCGRKLAVYYDGPAKSTPGYYRFRRGRS